jgi:hypothetical protein
MTFQGIYTAAGHVDGAARKWEGSRAMYIISVFQKDTLSNNVRCIHIDDQAGKPISSPNTCKHEVASSFELKYTNWEMSSCSLPVIPLGNQAMAGFDAEASCRSRL